MTNAKYLKMQKLKKYCAVVLLGAGITCGAVQVNAAPADREQAVLAARQGNYQQALAILEAHPEAESGYWADYISILCWDGQYAKARSVVNRAYQGDLQQLPLYVLKNLFPAYNTAGTVAELKSLGLIYAEQGEFDLALRAAEEIYLYGHNAMADEVYNKLLTQDKFVKGDIYFSKAKLAISKRDFIEAKKLYAAALDSVPQGSSRQLDYAAGIAPLYMRAGVYEKAVSVLEPYIADGSASNRMKADYLISLRFTGKIKEADAYYAKEFSDTKDFPTYGLQSMADMYFRLKQYDKAQGMYAEVLAREPENAYAQIAHAYTLAAQGKEQQAEREYLAVAEKYPARHNALALDAQNFVANGKMGLARRIFAALGTDAKSRAAYQLQYADSLSEHEHLIPADAVYKKLIASGQFDAEARRGLIENEVRRGRYYDAEKHTEKLDADYENEAAISKAYNFIAENKTFGEAAVYYEHSKDYKGNDITSYGIWSEHYLDGNWSLKQELYTSRYNKNGEHARINNFAIGPSYKFGDHFVDVLAVRSWGTYKATNVLARGGFGLSDYANLSWNVGKRPHAEAGAVVAGIDERYYGGRYEQRVNEKTVVGFDYERGFLSDHNDYYSLGADVTHNILNKEFHNNNLLFNYSYTTYDHEVDEYESPQLRVAYGIGISQKLIARDKRRSLEFINMLQWGHDNSEPTDFSPYSRIEYVTSIKNNQRLTVGAEYGWRTDKLRRGGSSMSHSHHGFYANYYWEW